MKSMQTLALATTLFCGSAVAGADWDAYERWLGSHWNRQDLTAMAFTQVSAEHNGIWYPKGRWGVGHSGLSTARVDTYASASFGSGSRAFASTTSTPTIAASGQFHTGWRDVLSVSGGTGTGVMRIRGHVEGVLSGSFSSMEFGQRVFSDLRPGVGQGAHATFTSLQDSVSLGSSHCSASDARRPSRCQFTVTGNKVRMDFTLAVPFQYGGHVFLTSTADGSARSLRASGPTAPYSGPSFSEFLNTSRIDAISVPDGAQISSAAGSLVFNGERWHYPAVPEPQTYALMALGLLVLGGVAKRRQRAPGDPADRA